MDSIQEKIKERAYSFYRQRNGEKGNEMDDWLKAEKEITGSQARASEIRQPARKSLNRGSLIQ
jgi:hypothetical protein